MSSCGRRLFKLHHEHGGSKSRGVYEGYLRKYIYDLSWLLLIDYALKLYERMFNGFIKFSYLMN